MVAVSDQLLATEETASEVVRQLIVLNDWQYEPEYELPSGKRIDYLVAARDGNIQFGIECKRRMSYSYDDYGDGMNAKTLADYFEQAAAYAGELEVPVFLGPVLHYGTGKSELYRGGTEMSSLAALNIFGGRLNVGTLVNMRSCWRTYWLMILRGATFWGYDWKADAHVFNEDRLSVARVSGAKKKRIPLVSTVKDREDAGNDLSWMSWMRENFDDLGTQGVDR
jgi:hypothetical protein